VGNTSEKIASALVLVDVVPHVDLAGADRIRTFMRSRPDGFATVEEAADAVAAYNSHRPRPTDTAGLMKNLRVRADGRLVWHWDPMIVQTSDHLEPPEFTSVLVDAATRVRIPTMLVRGLMSDVVTEAGVEEFRKILPELDVCDVVGAGHMVAGDKNDDFNRGVTGFLRLHLPLR
jgi:pimeloyl-ACP methyl ester carboxylesterase